MSAITTANRTVKNPIIKDVVTFLETVNETNGNHTLITVELAPKGGNDLHFHKSFDETFTVLEGRLGIQIEKEIIYLNKGESATAHKGQLHRFFNPSDEHDTSFNVLIQPGNQGFETAIQVAYGLACDGLTNSEMMPKSFYHLALLLYWGDTNLPGIYKWIEPLMRWLAKRAIKKGIDKELMAQYCIL
ncbi:MAG: cupin domain-containing protein [Lewinellaceae bacterium]|nr:cupin domain-containing protein [Lewinellaceae bacterium]